MVRLARLKQRRDFTKVAATRKKWVTNGFILQVCKRKTPIRLLCPRTTQHSFDQISDVRIGFTVSKKVGNAVVRNRTKRRLRALIDVYAGSGMLNSGFDLVLIGRKETQSIPFAKLQKDLKKALIKMGVLEIDPSDR